jgi:hypothetical protein
MKYICCGIDRAEKPPEMTEEQQQVMLDECSESDDCAPTDTLRREKVFNRRKPTSPYIGRTARSQSPTVPTSRPGSSSAALWCSRRET